jgi:hypothetical protein
MKTHIKFNIKEGQTRNSISDDIAKHLWQFFRLRDMDGKIGIENTVTNDEIRAEVGKYINSKKLVRTEDKINIDRYQLFLERTTRQAINKLIDPKENNTLFIPGLLNNPFVGYFIASNSEEVEEVRREKQGHIDGCTFNLESRTHEAVKYVDMLPVHKEKELLDDKKNREII